MNEFIYPEMMTHIGVCSHKNPKSVLLVSDNSELIEAELDRHNIEKVEVVTAQVALEIIKEKSDNSCDLVLLDLQMADPALLAHVNRVLNDDGMLVTGHTSLDNIEDNKSLIQILGNYFKIVMPFNVGNNSTLLLASKEYHPTADVILQRTDLINGLKYYNCDIHIAAFAMGNYVRKEYLGIIKN
ncbi:MAG: spermidine synthase [Helicobacteraceae bacterium]|nr:spermidine synthase [Helicobacteraceae bacterium]